MGAEDEEGRESPPAAEGFQWPSWFSKDDFLTVTIALCFSYGIRWRAQPYPLF